uniref:EGF-like domain-containing protein n=1 Tax=Arcella intermedia TaxID=1963864 RepID=A0A6B2KZX8_9EUKA
MVPEEECDGGAFCNSCQCYPGYRSVHQFYCEDINECLQPELNNCVQGCINTPGSYYCQCYVGYKLDADGTCKVKPCVFTNWGPWSACSKCEGTTHNRTRDINNTESAGSPACFQIASQLIEFEACRYPCYTDEIQDAAVAIDYLEREWDNSNWIQKIFDDNSLPLQCQSTVIDKNNKNIMHIYVTEKRKKRVLSDCSSSTMQIAGNLILNDTLSIMGISEERVKVSLLSANTNNTCVIQLQITQQTAFPIGQVLGGVIGGIVLLVIIGLIISFQYQLSKLRTLPPQLHWTFVSAKRDVFKLTWRKKHGSLAYYRSLRPSTSDFESVKTLFEEKLGGAKLEFEKVWAVYNEVLTTAFYQKFAVDTKRVRENQSLFQKKDWKQKDDSDLREFIYEQFVKVVQGFSWNTETTCPVIPVLHGTALSKAFKICDSGFAILGLLDSGYYGQGIYVTTAAEYALQYTNSVGKGDSPAIIIAYVLPGNPYPVTENPKSPESLAGSPIKTGYQSHYVRVKNGGGMPITKPRETRFDEIVIGQESAIVPAFILKISPSEILKLAQNNQRRSVEVLVGE